MSEEQVFLQAEGVHIDSGQIRIQGSRFETREVLAIAKRLTPAQVSGACGLMGCGGTVALGAVVFLAAFRIVGTLPVAGLPQEGPRATDLLLPFLVAGVLILGGMLWFIRERPTYHLVLTTVSGEHEVLDSSDERAIDLMIAALNQAMMAGRKRRTGEMSVFRE